MFCLMVTGTSAGVAQMSGDEWIAQLDPQN